MRISDWSSDVCSSDLIGDTPLCKARKGEKSQTRSDPLPKECPACNFLKPPKVRECPVCKFVPEITSDIEEEEGQLVQIGGKKREQSKAEKQLWYSGRSEERRVGKECGSTVRNRG